MRSQDGGAALRRGEVRPLRRALASVAAATVAFVFLGPAPSRAAAGFTHLGRVEFQGAIPMPLWADPTLRLAAGIITAAGGQVFTADLDSMTRGSVIETGIDGVVNGAIDVERHRLFLPGGDPGTLEPAIATVDLEKRRTIGVWKSRLFGGVNQSGTVRSPAVAYSPTDNRLYVARDVRQSPLTPSPPQVTLFAFDADKVAEEANDAMLWSYPVPVCQWIPPNSPSRPAFMGVSDGGEFLYFVCAGGAVEAASFRINSAMPGAVRLHLTPGLDAGDTSNFSIDFFPFPGTIENGFASGDPVGMRLYLVLLAGEPKLYVFDAVRGAWTGSVPVDSASSPGGTADPETGRIYVRTADDRSILVTEGAAVRVPQGQEYQLPPPPGNQVFGHPLFDPVHRRLWMPTEKGWDILEEHVPTPPPAVSASPDLLTSPEQPEIPGETVSTFSGSARAFGFRSILVSGLQGLPAYEQGARTVLESFPPPAFNPILNQLPFELPGVRAVRTGQRDLAMGRVLDVNMGQAGVGGGASGLTLDENTRGDFENPKVVTGQLNDAVKDTSGGQVDILKGIDDGTGVDLVDTLGAAKDDAIDKLGGSLSHCTGFTGDSAADEHPGSRVECDGSALAVEAAADSPADTSESLVKIGHASSRVRVTRRPDLGAVAYAEAEVRDIEIPGLLRIGRARTVVQSVAHGNRGTAGTRIVERFVDDVEVLTPAGEIAFSCGFGTGKDCEAPDVVAAAINRVLQPRVQALVPAYDADPLVFATEGGAKASFIKDPYQESNDLNTNRDQLREVPALQLVVYGDADRPSRLVLQLAAVSTDTNYTVNPLVSGPNGPSGPPPIPPEIIVMGGGPIGPPPPPQVIRIVDGSRGGITQIVQRAARGMAFILTNPREALLLGTVWALIGVPVYLAARRRALLGVVGGV